MPVLELARLTWEEVRALDRAKMIAVLPVGAIEAHGPHLPLATDVIIAEAMARAGADRLAAQGHEVLVLPAVVYTAAGFAAAFPGTLAPAPGTLTELIVGIAGSLARHKVPVLAIANAHLDPAHLDALHAAVERIRERQVGRVVFPDVTRKPWASRLTAEFKSGACHAGQFETSVVLAARPNEVREEIRRGLSPNPHSLAAAIAAGVKTFEEAGGSQAYFGFPADATAQEGRQTIAVLGAILAEAVLAELAR